MGCPQNCSIKRWVVFVLDLPRYSETTHPKHEIAGKHHMSGREQSLVVRVDNVVAQHGEVVLVAGDLSLLESDLAALTELQTRENNTNLRTHAGNVEEIGDTAEELDLTGGLGGDLHALGGTTILNLLTGGVKIPGERGEHSLQKSGTESRLRRVKESLDNTVSLVTLNLGDGVIGGELEPILANPPNVGETGHTGEVLGERRDLLTELFDVVAQPECVIVGRENECIVSVNSHYFVSPVCCNC
nr:MAG TPA: hypothetical protein [Caudoviricetes sp.]